jgi:hypothetical protein
MGMSAIIVVLFALLARPAFGDPVTIQPSDTLSLHFTTLAAPDCIFGPCDTLVFGLGFTGNPLGASITTAALFDSSMLLGIYRTDATCLEMGTCAGLVPSFVTPTSIYDVGSAVIDFTSVLDGTISGVLDIRFDKPIEYDPSSAFNFFSVGHATSRSGGGSGGYYRGYDSVDVTSVPEPASLMLLGAAGVASLIARRRLRKVEVSRDA